MEIGPIRNQNLISSPISVVFGPFTLLFRSAEISFIKDDCHWTLPEVNLRLPFRKARLISSHLNIHQVPLPDVSEYYRLEDRIFNNPLSQTTPNEMDHQQDVMSPALRNVGERIQQMKKGLETESLMWAS